MWELISLACLASKLSTTHRPLQRNGFREGGCNLPMVTMVRGIWLGRFGRENGFARWAKSRGRGDEGRSWRLEVGGWRLEVGGRRLQDLGAGRLKVLRGNPGKSTIKTGQSIPLQSSQFLPVNNKRLGQVAGKSPKCRTLVKRARPQVRCSVPSKSEKGKQSCSI